MKLITHVIRTQPNQIEEIQMEDVASIKIDDNFILVSFNTGEFEEIALRANDGEDKNQWSGFSLFATQVGLKVDMDK